MKTKSVYVFSTATIISALMTACGGDGGATKAMVATETTSSTLSSSSSSLARSVNSSSALSSSSSSITTKIVVKPTGYYAMTGLNTSATQKEELLALPFVNGMTSYISWSELEPTQGELNFSKIDADIALAKSKGKKLTIGIFTGRDSLPEWIDSAGVRTWTTSQGKKLVHPTDQKFIALWTERVKQLGLQYANNDAVVQVTICGATGTLCGPRYPELPADVSYADLIKNWSEVITAYMQAFPATYLNLEVHLTNGYGASLPIDLFAKIPSDAPVGPFAEFLSDIAPADDAPTAIAFRQIQVTHSSCGFQMVSPLGDKADEAVARGRKFGCEYFEIYPNDLLYYGNF